MTDRERHASQILSGVAKFERELKSTIAEKRTTTIQLQVKIVRGAVQQVRFSANEDIEPPLSQ